MSDASRIDRSFAAHPGTTGLIPFITAGYPSLPESLEMLRGFARLGARAVEIGIPFSDPIADGPDIQRASEHALRNGVSADSALELVAALRRESELPVVIMTYANPVVRPGIDAFARSARAAGVDGALLSDLPPDESPEIWEALDRHGIETVVLIAPTTSDARVPRLLSRARGFVYCLARTGVTGGGEGERGALPDRIAALRRGTRLPIAVGFGIAGPDDARRLRGVADAVVVGSAFMRAVAEDPARGAAARVLELAERLIRVLN
ncbi:MAG TPA: tryptophan synthase subunit alpha [Candidatus Limnocylindria bacterium]|nr:tryptophan synthase subunit alpha [Candidatus Limnocylindria bacterium]